MALPLVACHRAGPWVLTWHAARMRRGTVVMARTAPMGRMATPRPAYSPLRVGAAAVWTMEAIPSLEATAAPRLAVMSLMAMQGLRETRAVMASHRRQAMSVREGVAAALPMALEATMAALAQTTAAAVVVVALPLVAVCQEERAAAALPAWSSSSPFARPE